MSFLSVERVSVWVLLSRRESLCCSQPHPRRWHPRAHQGSSRTPLRQSSPFQLQCSLIMNSLSPVCSFIFKTGQQFVALLTLRKDPVSPRKRKTWPRKPPGSGISNQPIAMVGNPFLCFTRVLRLFSFHFTVAS